MVCSKCGAEGVNVNTCPWAGAQNPNYKGHSQYPPQEARTSPRSSPSSPSSPTGTMVSPGTKIKAKLKPSSSPLSASAKAMASPTAAIRADAKKLFPDDPIMQAEYVADVLNLQIAQQKADAIWTSMGKEKWPAVDKRLETKAKRLFPDDSISQARYIADGLKLQMTQQKAESNWTSSRMKKEHRQSVEKQFEVKLKAIQAEAEKLYPNNIMAQEEHINNYLLEKQMPNVPNSGGIAMQMLAEKESLIFNCRVCHNAIKSHNTLKQHQWFKVKDVCDACSTQIEQYGRWKDPYMKYSDKLTVEDITEHGARNDYFNDTMYRGAKYWAGVATRQALAK